MPTWVMLALVALLYGVAAWPLGADLRRLAELRVEQDVGQVDQRLRQTVARRLAELRQLARGLRRSALDEGLRAELEELQAQVPAYAWLAVTDPEGRVLVATRGWLEGQSLQGRPVFERGREALWFGEFHPAKLLRRYMAGGEQGEIWVADVAAPVHDAQGGLRAVVVAHLNAAWLEQLGQETLGQLRQSQLGLRWALRQTDGQLLSGAGGPPFPPVDASGSVVQQDAEGHAWLVAQRPVRLGVQDELQWQALVAQDLEAALAPQRKLYLWLGGLALLTLVLGGWLAHWLTRIAARPYAGLLAAAQRRAEASGAEQPDAELLGRLGDELLAGLQDPQTDPLLRRLASNARQLRRLLDQLPMGLAFCDTGQCLVFANRSLEQMLGAEPGELVGQPLAQLFPALAGGAPTQARSGRLELPRVEGGQRSLAWQRLPLLDRQQAFDGVLLLLQDQSGEVGERRRADLLQRRFAMLVNSALNDAFVMLDGEGRVRDWSLGAVQLTGWAAETAMGRPLAGLLDRPEDAPALLERIRQDGQAPLDTRLRRADGGSFAARGRLYRLADEDGGLALIFSDVTKEQEAALQLQDSEARLSAVVGGASDAIISTDAEGRVLLFNPAAERIFGVPQAQMLGQPLDRLLPPPERAGHVQRMQSFARSEATRRPMGVGKVNGLRADGELLVLEAAISAARVGGRRVLTAILRDVTERDRAEQRLVGYQVQLTELTQRLLAQEKETTRRLAQVLHDELGQTLAAMRLMLDAGLQRGEAPAWVQRLDSVLSTANRQVREVLTELRPPLLDDQGLNAALCNELRQQQGRHDEVTLRLDWQLPPAQRWPADVEYAGFMIVREALGNALRHAGARSITLHCSGSSTRMQLRVIDDGVGDEELASRLRPGHLGLVGMRERALAIGARLELVSSPQSGTTVSLFWESHEPSVSD